MVSVICHSTSLQVIRITSTEPDLDWTPWLDDLPDTTNDVSLNAPKPSGKNRRDELAISDHRRQMPGSPPKPNQQTDNVPDELRVISQPKNIKLKDISSYAYEYETVGHVRVYLIDSGIDKYLPVSRKHGQT